MPPNRIVALFAPFVALAAGVAATWLTDHVSGLDVSAGPARGRVHRRPDGRARARRAVAARLPEVRPLRGGARARRARRRHRAAELAGEQDLVTAEDEYGAYEDEPEDPAADYADALDETEPSRSRPEREMPVNGTAPRPAAAPPLIERLRAAGLVAPRTTVREAERAGLPLALACALLEKESSGGRNVFGHDPTIFAGAGKVTRANYATTSDGGSPAATG